MKTRNNKLKTNGFALFISILVASIVLSVSFGVFDITLKELKLSGLGQESQIAFYAADAGIECFFYWEIKHPGLTDSAFEPPEGVINTINCAGNNIQISGPGPYSFNINLSNISCVKIKVTKSGLVTTVESKGYNMDCDSSSPLKVERAIKIRN